MGPTNAADNPRAQLPTREDLKEAEDGRAMPPPPARKPRAACEAVDSARTSTKVSAAHVDIGDGVPTSGSEISRGEGVRDGDQIDIEHLKRLALILQTPVKDGDVIDTNLYVEDLSEHAHRRPPCVAAGCNKTMRPNSHYCSAECGVTTAQLELLQGVRFKMSKLEQPPAQTVDPRQGLVNSTMQKVNSAKPPRFEGDHEASPLKDIASRRHDILQNLAGIPNYWEAVTTGRSAATAAAAAAANPLGLNAALRHLDGSNSRVVGAGGGEEVDNRVPHDDKMEARPKTKNMKVSYKVGPTEAPGGTPAAHGISFPCPYCAEQTGPNVKEHLESCYRKSVARRNARLDDASLVPLPDNRHLQGGSPAGVASVTKPAAMSAAVASNSTASMGRELLSRRVSYASLDALPGFESFQLHESLEGWSESPSRLDFLHKELNRQLNDTTLKLHDLDKEEAALETRVRRRWAHDGLGLRFDSDSSLEVTPEQKDVFQQSPSLGEVFEMEALLNIGESNDGSGYVVRVRWSGFGEKEDTWEPLKTLLEDAPQFVEEQLRAMNLGREVHAKIKHDYGITLF